MDQESLKKLRTKIPVNLKEAIELLKKNDGSIEASEREFHQLRIAEIGREAECDLEKASHFYRKFDFDKEKAIRGINEEQTVLTIGESKIGKNAIGFILWFEEESGERYKTVKRHDVFIPAQDFDYIIEVFQSNCAENFEIRASNYFDKTNCKSIIAEIDRMETKRQDVNKFLEDLKGWVQSHLNDSMVLVVSGNL